MLTPPAKLGVREAVVYETMIGKYPMENDCDDDRSPSAFTTGAAAAVFAADVTGASVTKR